MARVAKGVKEVAESSKRIARMKKAKAKARMEVRPDWLPEGWIVDVQASRSGRKHYTFPGSGLTFCSKQKVLRYIEDKNVGGDTADTSFSEHNKSTVEAQVMNSPEWLPHGWVLEIKTRLRGAKAGKKYKCYFDPVSGSRFYSKVDVLSFLKSGHHNAPATGGKKHLKASTTDNVLAQIEYSPDGLPPGWMKEIIYRKSNTNNTSTRNKGDPYYTDPVTGYVFKSLTDAVRYVKTGELSKYAIGPRKRSLVEMYSLERESPPPISAKELKSLVSTTRRSLSTKDASTSNLEMVMEINGSTDKLWLPPPDHALSENFQKGDPTSSPDTEHMEEKVNKKRRQILESESDSLVKASKHVVQKAKRGRPIITMPGLAVESERMDIASDESPDKLQLPHSDLASSSSFQNTDTTSSPDIGHMEGKADEKISNGLEEATGSLLDTSKHGEHKAKRRRTTKMWSISEKENKGSGVLLELTVATKKSSEATNAMTPAYQEKTQKRSKAKSLTLPMRRSKRLAGLEPAPGTDLTIHRPSCQPISSVAFNGIEESVTLSEPKRMGTAGEIHRPLSNGVRNQVEGSATLPESERMDAAVETSRPLSTGVCNGTEEIAPLEQPERMHSALEPSQPLTNDMHNEIEASMPLIEDESMGTAEAASLGSATHRPPSKGVCNQIEGSATLPESERMDAAVETSRTVGVCNQSEGSATLHESERKDAAVETSRPLPTVVYDGTEELGPLVQPERMHSAKEPSQPLTNDMGNEIEASMPLIKRESMGTAEAASLGSATHRPLSNGVCNQIEGSATLPESERMDAAEETSRPLSTGVCDGTEELAPLERPERMHSALEPSQPLTNDMRNEIEASMPLIERESMGTAEAACLGSATHRPLSNGVCNQIEGSATLPESERMDAAVETSGPLSIGVCNGIEELSPLEQPERMHSAEELSQPPSNDMRNEIEASMPLIERESTGTAGAASLGSAAFRPLSNGVCNQIEGSENLPESERIDAAIETSRPLSTGVYDGTEELAPLEQPERMHSAEEHFLPQSNDMRNEIETSMHLIERESMGTAEAASLGGHVLLTGQTSEDWLSSPFSIPFSDVWSDPCIEFAVKTLMGDIPLLDEGLAIEEYIQKQLSSADILKPSSSVAAVASDHQGLGPEKPLGQQQLPPSDEGKQFPTKNGLPSHTGASPKVKG